MAITFVDDFVAGPILAATGAFVGGKGGVVLGVVVFTVLVGVLVGSAVWASRGLDPQVQARIDHAVSSASKRSFAVGMFAAWATTTPGPQQWWPR